MLVQSILGSVLGNSLVGSLLSSSGPSPIDVSGNVLWLDASDSDTVLHVVNSVYQWSDKLDRGLNAVQGSAGKQPITNAATQNGLNTISFDNSNDRMDVLSVFGGAPITEFTIIGAYKYNTNPVGGNSRCRALGFGSRQVDGDTASLIHMNQAYDSSIRFDGGSLAGSQPTSNTFRIRSTTKDVSDYKDYINGNNNIDAAEITPNIVDDVYMGFIGLSMTDMEFGEVLVYNRTLDLAELQYVEDYLNAKWSAY